MPWTSPRPRYEVAVMALAEFGRHGFADTTFGSATKLQCAGESTRGSACGFGREGVRAWLDRTGKSPPRVRVRKTDGIC